MFIKRYNCTFGDLFLLGRYVEEVTFFNVRLYSIWKRYLFGKNGTQLGKRLDYGPSWKCLTMVAVCRPVRQILILFQTKNCLFSHPLSDLASKINTHSRDWPLRNYVIITTDLFRIRVFLFLSYSFGIEPINTFVQSCSSTTSSPGLFPKGKALGTRLVVPLKTIPDSRSKWAKSTPFFTPKRPKKPYPLGRHVPIWLI